MILTGREIAAEVAAGRIHISPFDPSRLEPNSYGLGSCWAPPSSSTPTRC